MNRWMAPVLALIATVTVLVAVGQAQISLFTVQDSLTAKNDTVMLAIEPQSTEPTNFRMGFQIDTSSASGRRAKFRIGYSYGFTPVQMGNHTALQDSFLRLPDSTGDITWVWDSVRSRLGVMHDTTLTLPIAPKYWFWIEEVDTLGTQNDAGQNYVRFWVQTR